MTVQPDVAERLNRFAALLLRWNAKLNLIAPADEPVLWHRHIADSLQLVPLLPPVIRRAVDLGSGGGFPGLVLAIATGLHVDLIESDKRKAAFLRTAILETGANAIVYACRIEAVQVPPADLVTARALAPLPRLLPLAARFLKAHGTCLFLKGARADEEIAQALVEWDMIVARTPSETGPDGVVLRISDLRPRAAR